MSEDDAAFEASITLAIAQIESIMLPMKPMATLYALMWCAAREADRWPASREMFAQVFRESDENFPWGTLPKMLDAFDFEDSDG